MKERTSLALAAVAVVAILAACGGGGGGSSAGAPAGITGAPGTTAPTLVAPAGTLKATLNIRVPAGAATSSTSRSIKLVPSNTKAIVFSLLQTTGAGLAPGSVQGPFGLTATSPGCSQDAQSNVNCSLQINAPIGDNIFTADIFSSPTAAAGTKVGSGAVKFSVVANATNSAQISLNGPIAKILLVSDCPATNVPFFFTNACILGDVNFFNHQQLAATARQGQAIQLKQVVSTPLLQTLRIVVIALDASGGVIVNPTVYDQPITLELLSQPNPPSMLALNASYSSVSLPFTNVASASTAANGGTIQLWSPLDVATVTLVPNAVGIVEGYVFSSIGTSVPVPVSSPFSFPSASPSMGPYLLVGAAMQGATPSPSPTPTPGPLTFTNPQNYPVVIGIDPQFTTTNGTANPTEFIADFPAPVPSLASPGPALPITFTFGLTSNYAYTGTYTFTDGGTYPGCAASFDIMTLPGTITASGVPFQSTSFPLTLIATSPGTCSITAQDSNGNTSVLDIFIERSTLIINGRNRK
jgi:hypothetical protein